MPRNRDKEVVCNCGRYDFPHRMFSGCCRGDIRSYFWQDASQCMQCNEKPDEPGCECAVVEDRESPKVCLYAQGLYPDGQVMTWNPRLN
jgi:hypothetical protein